MAEVSLLFWNIAGKDLRQRVARLTVGRTPDLLILAENPIPPDELVEALEAGGADFHFAADSEVKLGVFSRLPRGAVQLGLSQAMGRATFRRVSIAGMEELLVVAVHLPSQLHWSRDDQTLFASRLAEQIRDFEATIGHTRTVVIGDFNMSPFDPGMAAAGALPAVMTVQLAARQTREVVGEEEPMFYSPMWGLFGDRTPGPPGSYYFRSSKPLNYFWLIYDQVLLRPALAPALTEVALLDHDGVASLLTVNGLPDVVNGSDHLPLFVRLRF